MTRKLIADLGIGIALFVTLSVTAAAPEVVQRNTTASGSTIIAFVPSAVEGQQDDGAIEGIAHVQYSLRDTVKCLRPKPVSLQFWFADRLVIRSGGKTSVIEVGKSGQGFGAILVEPGRLPKLIYSTEGPSTLQYLLPQAAFEYWNAPGCNLASE